MRHRAWYVLSAVAVLAVLAPETARAQEKSKEKPRTSPKVERVKSQAPARSARSSAPVKIQSRAQPAPVKSLSRKATATKPVSVSARRVESKSERVALERVRTWQPERVKSGSAGTAKGKPVDRGVIDRDPPDRGNGLKRGQGDDRDPPGRGNGWKRGGDDRDRGGRPGPRERPGDSDDRSWDSERAKWDGVGDRPVVIRRPVVRDRWVYGGYGTRVYDPYGYWHWNWYDDPFWHDHTSIVFVFRRGHGHHFHGHHVRFGHHHGVHLHHGFFHDFLFDHHGHIHFVIVVRTDPVYTTVPVYHAPVGWVIEEREVPVLVGQRVPGAYYDSGSCAELQIVTREGSVLPIRVDPADFGAENVGQLRDILEEALAATGQLDVEDLAGVRHVIPRESILEIRGSACGVE